MQSLRIRAAELSDRQPWGPFDHLVYHIPSGWNTEMGSF